MKPHSTRRKRLPSSGATENSACLPSCRSKRKAQLPASSDSWAFSAELPDCSLREPSPCPKLLFGPFLISGALLRMKVVRPQQKASARGRPLSSHLVDDAQLLSHLQLPLFHVSAQRLVFSRRCGAHMASPPFIAIILPESWFIQCRAKNEKKSQQEAGATARLAN